MTAGACKTSSGSEERYSCPFPLPSAVTSGGEMGMTMVAVDAGALVMGGGRKVSVTACTDQGLG